MKEKKSKSEDKVKKKRKSGERRQQKKKELWALYDDLEPNKEVGCQTGSNQDDLTDEVARLKAENDKLTNRFNRLVSTAQREVKNLKKSRDEYRTKYEEYEKSRRRHFETPKYLFDIFSSKYGYANASNLTEAEKRKKSRQLLQTRLGRGKGVRFDPNVKRNIGDYTEQDYFRLFFEKDHQSTQTDLGSANSTRKKFRSKGSCTRDQTHLTKSTSCQTGGQEESDNLVLKNILFTVAQNETTDDPKVHVNLPEPEPPNTNDTLESIDEFTTNRGSVPEHEHDHPPKVTKNMKTRVQFDSETWELSEIRVPATPLRAAEDSHQSQQSEHLFSGPEITPESSQDSLQIQNKATIKATPLKPTPSKTVGSSKRKSQTPKKLTPDRNESPRHASKRKRKDSSPKKQIVTKKPKSVEPKPVISERVPLLEKERWFSFVYFGKYLKIEGRKYKHHNCYFTA